MKIFLRGVAVLLGLLLLLLVALAFSIRNPWDWGMQRSARFSERAFREIRPGDSLDAAIAALGEPIETGRPENGYPQCLGEPCTPYLFAGHKTLGWMIGSREFYVLVDAGGEVKGSWIQVKP